MQWRGVIACVRGSPPLARRRPDVTRPSAKVATRCSAPSWGAALLLISQAVSGIACSIGRRPRWVTFRVGKRRRKGQCQPLDSHRFMARGVAARLPGSPLQIAAEEGRLCIALLHPWQPWKRRPFATEASENATRQCAGKGTYRRRSARARAAVRTSQCQHKLTTTREDTP